MRQGAGEAGTGIPAAPTGPGGRNAALFREELRHRLHLLPIGGVREVAEAELRLERREERVVVVRGLALEAAGLALVRDDDRRNEPAAVRAAGPDLPIGRAARIEELVAGREDGRVATSVRALPAVGGGVVREIVLVGDDADRRE